MTSPATEARVALSTALDEIDGLTVHAVWPQGAVNPPMAVIRPREPWMRPITLAKTEVAVYVDIAVKATGSNNTAIVQLEDLAGQASVKLRAAGAMVGNVSAPTTTEIGSTQLMVSTIEALVHVTDEGATP
jgi:hypothetical protein